MSKQKIVALGFFVSILLSPPVVFAKTPAAVETVSPTPTPQISGEILGTQTKKKVEYMLPYPGILVDNPLYFLKRFRDQMLEKLIVDPVRKAEFHILQADKFLNMGVFLSSQGKSSPAGTVITQAETYMKQAVDELIVIRGNGTQIPGWVVDRLEKSTAKHIEVLEEMLTKIDASQKETVNSALTAVTKVQGELTKLK